MLAQLRQDHDRTCALFDRLNDYLDALSSPVDIEFSRLRWALIRHLTVHHARDPACGDPASATIRTCLAKSVDSTFDDYVSTWTARAIQRDWTGYCRASRALFRQVRERMQREQAQLFLRLSDRATTSAAM